MVYCKRVKLPLVMLFLELEICQHALLNHIWCFFLLLKAKKMIFIEILTKVAHLRLTDSSH